ncbi:MAG: CNP1-like family protein [Lentisphaerae bacterium]|nr:CNP1-like family protein [Lentisphaerota bacterium]
MNEQQTTVEKWTRFRGTRWQRHVCLLAAVLAATGAGAAPPQSGLATLGRDGKLVYAPYTERGDRLPDFSWCGYRGGGVALPAVPVKVTLTPIPEGDDRERIQQALDAVAALPLGADGFRGALLLKKGVYRVGGQLNIRTSGVVLRGEGDGTNGTVIIASARTKYTVLYIAGAGGPEEDTPSRREVTADYVPVGARAIPVADAGTFKVGDQVLVCREGNQSWIDTLGMNKLSRGPGDKVHNWGPFALKFQRVVTAVGSKGVTVDAPIVNAIDRAYGGGYVVRYRYPGRIENVGVEGIRCDSVYASPTDHAHAWRFIIIDNAQNVWVRNCTALHMAYACVEIRGNVKWATVQDTQCLDMISRIKGGLRYAFALSGQLCLVQRCFGREGRHDFVMHAWVPGPNVFLDCRSENPHADSGPHHRYATGTLYDNVETGGLNVVNRGRSGTGHGWAGAQMVFWNCKAGGMNCARPPTAQNFAIGCTVKGGAAGDGYWESTNAPVAPRSLYLQQLRDRMGPAAIQRIGPSPAAAFNATR